MRRGFALIEVLVVLVIVGVLVGLAQLAVPGQSPQEARSAAAERLLRQLRLAQEQALLSGKARALELSRSGYRFLAFVPDPDADVPWELAAAAGRWQPASSDVLESGTAPDGTAFALRLAGQPASLPGRLPPAAEAKPAIVINPDGTAEAFRLTLRPVGASGRAIALTGDGLGAIARAEAGP